MRDSDERCWHCGALSHHFNALLDRCRICGKGKTRPPCEHCGISHKPGEHESHALTEREHAKVGDAPAEPAMVAPPLPRSVNACYSTIVADPPWRYDSDSNRRAKVTYETMTTGEMAMMRVGDLAEQDAHLWLWTTNAFMEEAHRIARAWGFRPLTIVTWCKPGPGVGHYIRNNTEHVIFASKGRAQTPVSKPLSSWFEWPRTSHSTKPSAFYDLVEQVSPGPYLELFARTRRLGWHAWGNEVDSDVEMAS